MSNRPLIPRDHTRPYKGCVIHDYDAYAASGGESLVIANQAPRRYGVFFVLNLPGRGDRVWMEYFHTLKAAKAAITDWREGAKEELLQDFSYNSRNGRF